MVYFFAAIVFYVALALLPLMVVAYMIAGARQRRRDEINAEAPTLTSLPSARIYQPEQRKLVLHPEEGAPLRLAVRMVIRDGARRTRHLVRRR